MWLVFRSCVFTVDCIFKHYVLCLELWIRHLLIIIITMCSFCAINEFDHKAQCIAKISKRVISQEKKNHTLSDMPIATINTTADIRVRTHAR